MENLTQRNASADNNGDTLGTYQQQAYDILSSNRLADAFDVSLEPQAVQERYGTGKPYKFQYDGAPTVNDQLLIARRLVEAGVRVVTLSYGRWDSHGDNEEIGRAHV